MTRRLRSTSQFRTWEQLECASRPDENEKNWEIAMSKNRFVVALAATLLLNGCGPSAWDEARTADTIEALEAFVEQNPESEHVGEAMARIDSLWQTRWVEVSAANTRSKFVEFVRSGASGDHLAAAREAVMALQEQPSAAGGKIEMYGMYGPSGLIEDVDAIASRYDGVIAGMPASVEYAIKAGVDADGEPQHVLQADEAVLFALNEYLAIEHIH